MTCRETIVSMKSPHNIGSGSNIIYTPICLCEFPDIAGVLSKYNAL